MSVICFSPTVNGGYSNWEEWAPCSSTCGQGFQERIRLCNNPKPANGGRSCSGPGVDSRKCQAGLCPGKESLSFLTVNSSRFSRHLFEEDIAQVSARTSGIQCFGCWVAVTLNILVRFNERNTCYETIREQEQALFRVC